MRKEIIAATRRLDRPTQYALNLLSWARLDKAHAEFVGELPGIAQQLSALERRQHVGSVANGALRLDGKPLRDQPLPAACLGIPDRSAESAFAPIGRASCRARVCQ